MATVILHFTNYGTISYRACEFVISKSFVLNFHYFFGSFQILPFAGIYRFANKNIYDYIKPVFEKFIIEIKDLGESPTYFVNKMMN